MHQWIQRPGLSPFWKNKGLYHWLESSIYWLTLFFQDIILVEFLKLDNVKTGIYMLHCLPLRLVGSEGSPVRCILIKWSLRATLLLFSKAAIYHARWCYIYMLANIVVYAPSLYNKHCMWYNLFSRNLSCSILICTADKVFQLEKIM
jgi:hypothetical protein